MASDLQAYRGRDRGVLSDAVSRISRLKYESEVTFLANSCVKIPL